MKTVKIGMLGFGCRGKGLLKDVIVPNKKAEVVAVCDLYEDRTKEAQEIVKNLTGKVPFGTQNPSEVINHPDVEVVIIATAWESHIPLAIESMKAGKRCAMEVGGAYSVEQCWDLVRCSQNTGVETALLENCCFGKRELFVRNMVELGLFGEIVHCSGGYMHDLRDEVAFGNENRHYRLRNYLNRNCENYPTHELGPIAKILKINRGNRMVSLTSTASKSAGLHEFILQNKADDAALVNAHFNQGDVVTTVIKCAGGETVTITLDTTLPRYYSRGFTVRGTKGMYEEATDSVFLDSEKHNHFKWKEHWGNAEEYVKQYEHPIWKKYHEDGVQGSHDGMDWLEFDRYFDAVLDNRPFEIDVYDAAAWMSITALSAKSIALGSAPVEIPDFTEGAWITRQ